MNIFPCEIQCVANGFILRPAARQDNSYHSGASVISETFVFNSLNQMFEWMKDQHKESGTFCPDIK